MRIATVLLVLPLLASCAWPQIYEDPKRVTKVDKLREQRDLCLIQNIPQFDDRSADAKKVGDYVAMSCSNETSKLVEMAIPYPSRHDRDAFQQEAVFRATGYVMTARRMETDSVDRQRQQPSQPLPPTPLQ
jgi:hypothetical protein